MIYHWKERKKNIQWLLKKMFSLQWHFWTIFGPILCKHPQGTFFLGIHPTHETRAIDFMISPHQHDNISKLLKMNTVESKSDYIYHHSPWILDKFKFRRTFVLSSPVMFYIKLKQWSRMLEFLLNNRDRKKKNQLWTNPSLICHIQVTFISWPV